MSRAYYDLVAGLPIFSLFGERELPDFASVTSHLAEVMEPEDSAALRLLRLPFDNRNAAAKLLGLPRSFDLRGNWSSDELDAELNRPDALPSYLQQWVAQKGEGGESRLDALFFEWASLQEPSWISNWFRFELHLRGLLAVLMRRKYESVGGALEIPQIDELVERIECSAAADCGLSQPLPWVPQLLAALDQGPLEMEKAADQIRWEMAGDLSALHHFGVEEIFTFTVRLALAARWAQLDAASGRARLDRLVETLQVTVP